METTGPVQWGLFHRQGEILSNLELLKSTSVQSQKSSARLLSGLADGAYRFMPSILLCFFY